MKNFCVRVAIKKKLNENLIDIDQYNTRRNDTEKGKFHPLTLGYVLKNLSQHFHQFFYILVSPSTIIQRTMSIFSHQCASPHNSSRWLKIECELECRMKKKDDFFLFLVLYPRPIYSPSSTHISPSSMSFRPVGHAHDIRGLRSVIFGAGKQRCEQCPLTA